MIIRKEQVLSALAIDDPLRELHAAARALPQQVEERLLEMDVAGESTAAIAVAQQFHNILFDLNTSRLKALSLLATSPPSSKSLPITR